ncbi:MAG TPA: thiolase family protein [Galbitalea sp.]|jgi:acetyl-CoA acetyltransferase
MTVVIAGVAESEHGESSWVDVLDLEERLVLDACSDAGVASDELDAILTVPPRAGRYLVDAAAVAERLGAHPRYAFTLEAGGTAPITMVDLARRLIESGSARQVAVVAADLALTGVGRGAYVGNLAAGHGPVHPEIEAPYHPTVVSLFALVASRYLFEHGLHADALGEVAVQASGSAQTHPLAHLRESFTIADYRESRMISSPLRLLDCAPVSDGGGAVIVTGAEDPQDERPRVLGIGSATSQLHLSAANAPVAEAYRRASAIAELESGVAVVDVDLALVYDCFTIAAVLAVESLGLARPGTAPARFSAGDFGAGGTMPVNPHGGLLRHGHPARAGGMSNLVEAVLQLRGLAEGRQVPDCRRAVVHGMTGVFAQQAVMLLGWNGGVR